MRDVIGSARRGFFSLLEGRVATEYIATRVRSLSVHSYSVLVLTIRAELHHSSITLFTNLTIHEKENICGFHNE